MLRSIAIAFAILGFVSQAALAATPNILFLFTDDQAPWALGASGHPHAVTPHMDRIAKEGAYLVNSFTTTPVCSPSRASLMTSRYGSEVGITDWINPRVEPQLGLDPSTVTWPEVLQQHGYRTGLVGKWHLGLTPEFHPHKTGFDYFMGFLGGGNSPVDPMLEKDGQERKFKGFTPDILTDHAIEFLRTNRQVPFALAVHYRAPHARWLPVAEQDWSPFESLDPTIPSPDFPKLDVPRVKRMTREYLASVHSVDRNVGRVLDLLDELQLAENTVVIYSSDHGYNMGHNGMWHKGNGHWILTQLPEGTENIPALQRPNMYDNSLRVPLAIRWPGVIAPKTVINETVTILDWFPTLLDMAGVPLPPDLKIHGRSIVPLIKGTANNWDNTLYAEYSTHHQSKTAMRMYRTPRWKLKKDFLNPGRDELYNLELDPEERDNIIDSPSAEVRNIHHELNEKILATMQKLDDPALK